MTRRKWLLRLLMCYGAAATQAAWERQIVRNFIAAIAAETVIPFRIIR